MALTHSACSPALSTYRNYPPQHLYFYWQARLFKLPSSPRTLPSISGQGAANVMLQGGQAFPQQRNWWSINCPPLG